jgi:hypothetical protein
VTNGARILLHRSLALLQIFIVAQHGLDQKLVENGWSAGVRLPMGASMAPVLQLPSRLNMTMDYGGISIRPYVLIVSAIGVDRSQ